MSRSICWRRVYISHDVVFDEHVFPFTTLHPNVGALLRKELSILPDALVGSEARFGDAILLDRCDDSLANTCGPSHNSSVRDAGVNEASNGADLGADGGDPCVHGRHFMCRPPGDSVAVEGDSPGVGASGSPTSTPRLAPILSPYPVSSFVLPSGSFALASAPHHSSSASQAP